jgi:molybdopterin-guanine dinucleotide biosynthesis protein B
MSPSEKPCILGFYGESQSGKTTLMERIIAQLTHEGQRVAVIKKTDQPINIDTKGKDTSLFSQAGAELVIFSTEIETTYLINRKSDINEILAKIQQLGDFDFIFIEGTNDRVIPKIRLGNIMERENTLFTYDGNYEQLIAKIKNKNLPIGE